MVQVAFVFVNMARRSAYAKAAHLLHEIVSEPEKVLHGDPDARRLLAEMYRNGLGVPRDPIRACSLARDAELATQNDSAGAPDANDGRRAGVSGAPDAGARFLRRRMRLALGGGEARRAEAFSASHRPRSTWPPDGRRTESFGRSLRRWSGRRRVRHAFEASQPTASPSVEVWYCHDVWSLINDCSVRQHHGELGPFSLDHVVQQVPPKRHFDQVALGNRHACRVASEFLQDRGVDGRLVLDVIHGNQIVVTRREPDEAE